MAMADSRDRPDIASLKEQVEQQLKRDRRKADFVKSNLAESEQLKTKMVTILESFGQRLEALEGAIRPVYHETVHLTRAKDNVHQVLTKLDGVVHFYDTAAQVQKTLGQGPAYQLEAFLEAMQTTKNAILYFEEHNRSNSERARLTKLLNNGLRSLEKEFKNVLERHSFSVPAAKLLQLPLEEVLNLPSLPEDVIPNLKTMAAWLTNVDCTAELSRAYSQVRSRTMKASLAAFSERQNSGGAPTTTGRRATAQFSTPRTARQTSVRKKLMKRTASIMRKGPDQDSKPLHHTPSSSDALEDFEELGNFEQGARPFMMHAKALLRLLQREAILASKILGPLTATVLHTVYSGAMELFLDQGELLVASMRRHIEKHEHLTVMPLFELVAFFHEEGEAFTKVLKATKGHKSLAAFHELSVSFATLTQRNLLEFEDSVSSQVSRKLPPDGTVHELTSNTMTFLIALYDHMEVAGCVLRETDSLGDARTGIIWASKEVCSKSVTHWLLGVLETLCRNIKRKAKTYELPTLSCVFLFNNLDYVLKTTLGSPYAPALAKYHRNYREIYDQRIQIQRELYQSCSWKTAQEFLAVEDVSGALSKKDKERIKDKYNGFNLEIEEQLKEQQQFTIPNAELRALIKNDNKKLLLPLFEQFDKTYRHSGFSTKNPHKYLKYTPQDVADMLESFFAS